MNDTNEKLKKNLWDEMKLPYPIKNFDCCYFSEVKKE